MPTKPPVRNVNITSSSQPVVVRHVITSSRGIPMTMSLMPPYTPEVSKSIQII